MNAPDLTAFAASIEAELRSCGNAERAEHERAYLKSTLTHLGVPVPAARAVVKRFGRDHPEVTGAKLRALVSALWNSDVYERRLAAVLLLVSDTKHSQPEDVVLIERLLRESRTWALVDVLAADVMGQLIERFPDLAVVLDRWATDEDFWIRRAALLALLGALRRGGGDWEHFARLAEPMLEEREFFIRKAIGWVLRETSKRRPELVADWLRPRLAVVSGVTLREALRRLPPELAEELRASAPVHRGRARATVGATDPGAGS